MKRRRQHQETQEAELGSQASKRLDQARRALNLRLTDAAQRYFGRKAAAEEEYETERRRAYQEFYEREQAIRGLQVEARS